MNRIKTAIVLLLITGAICTAEFLYVSKTSGEFIDILHGIEEDLNEGKVEDALESAKEADRKWQARLKFIDIFLFHDYVDEIGRNISSIAKHIEYGDKASLFATCEITKRELKSLVESEKPLTENIL